MCRVRDSGVLGPEWEVCTKVLPSKHRGPCRRGSRKIGRTRGGGLLQGNSISSRYNRVNMHMRTQRRGQHTLLHGFKADKSPAPRRGTCTQTATLTKRLPAVNTCWGRGDLFSPVEWHWVHQPHSKAVPCPGVAGQHKQTPCFCVPFSILWFHFAICSFNEVSF